MKYFKVLTVLLDSLFNNLLFSLSIHDLTWPVVCIRVGPQDNINKGKGPIFLQHYHSHFLKHMLVQKSPSQTVALKSNANLTTIFQQELYTED